jgi:hypothetical protein
MSVSDSTSNRWTGQWIWDRAPLRGKLRQVIAAKKVVELDAVPNTVPARAFADALYVLYVNGVEVRRGPGRANPRSRRYDLLDLAPWLTAGTNVVTLVAAINAKECRNWMPAPVIVSDLGGGCLVFEANFGGQLGIVGTDESWQTTTIEGWTLSEPTGIVSQRGSEIIDLGAIPGDLHSAESDPTVWRAPRIKVGVGMGDRESVRPPSYPFGPTQPSALSPLVVTERPLAPHGDDQWRLPSVGSGTLVFDISGSGGEAIRVETAEVIEADGSLRPFHEEIGLELTAPEGRRQVETLDLFGLQAIHIEKPDSVTIHGITLRERTYPLAGNGTFKSSDPFLDQLYAAGRRTVTLCSIDAYIDNPTREGRAWTGDAVVHQMVDFASNADWGLARWNPKLGGLSTTPDGMVPGAVAGDGEYGQYGVITDWSLHWVHSVWNIHRYTGNVDEVADLLPEAERIVRWFDQFINPVTGLPTDVYGWTLVDWAWVATNGASAVLCGLLGRACRDLAEMSRFVGDHGRAERAERRHAALAQAFERFWDADRRRYADTIVNDAFGPTASIHSQAIAVAAGFAPADRLDRLVELMSDKSLHVHATLSVPDGDPGMDGAQILPGAEMMLPELPPAWWDADAKIVMAQPFFRYVVHDALAAAGRTELIFESLKDWSHLLDRCPTSFGETFWSGSLAQGWSSTPVRDLITYIAGITPAEPGFTKAAIAPVPGHLDWFEAVAPTPHGEIAVAYRSGETTVTSPVPFVFGGNEYPAGEHVLAN